MDFLIERGSTWFLQQLSSSFTWSRESTIRVVLKRRRFEAEQPNPQFPFTLLAKMCWSKNVLEERDAPDQIVIGAMDRRYCILLALGIYLEAWMESKSEPQTGIYLATLTNSRSVTQIINQMSSDVPV
jgi:hypothetical protein